jgi:hypothetical protein
MILSPIEVLGGLFFLLIKVKKVGLDPSAKLIEFNIILFVAMTLFFSVEDLLI